MKNFVLLSGVLACIFAGAIGGVLLLVSGWTILLAPFWMAGCIRTAVWLGDKGLYPK